jgi:hypothetical protein
MNLFIPPLKSVLVLKSAWKFEVGHESTNKSLFKVLGVPFYGIAEWRKIWTHYNPNFQYPGRWQRGPANLSYPYLTTMFIPAGAELVVDQYSIKNSSKPDTVTFRVRKIPGTKRIPRVRVTLDQTVGIDYDVVRSTMEYRKSDIGYRKYPNLPRTITAGMTDVEVEVTKEMVAHAVNAGVL